MMALALTSALLMVSAKTAVSCRCFHSQVGLMELEQGLHPARENLTGRSEVA